MGVSQNDKVHQDIVYCFRTETYILYENLILQQPHQPGAKHMPSNIFRVPLIRSMRVRGTAEPL